jgi:hypothetical protein
LKLLLAGAAILLIFTAMPAYAQNSSSGSPHKYMVHVGDKPYIITYNITGGSVQSIQANATHSFIAVMIQAYSNGKLIINLPGSLLNSISFEKYEPVIFLDGIEEFGNTTHTNCDATLEIPFQKGGERIDIAGVFQTGGQTSTKGNSFDAAVDGGKGFKLATVANADTCNFSFDQGKKQLHIETSGPANKEEGFFQIALPHEFLGGPYTVLAEGQPIEFETAFSNATGKDITTISFQYDGEKVHNINIIGTTAIPEFGPATIAAIAIPMAMLMIVRFKRQ